MMVEYGMPIKEVLRSATSTNASVFELKRLGQIKAGFLADLIVVDGNPLEHMSYLRKVKLVMKDGIVFRNDF